MKKPLDKEFVALIIDLYSQFRAIMKLGDPMSQKIVIRDFNALQGQIQEYLAKEDITQDALQQALTKADPEFKKSYQELESFLQEFDKDMTPYKKKPKSKVKRGRGERA